MGRDAAIAAECDTLLEQFRLAEHADQPTRELPYGKRRLLEIGLAVALKPSVLLLDEPAAGVPANERKDILDTVAALPADVSVLLIEHDMDLVFSFARRITVLVNGAVLTEGTPDAIAADPQVRAVYLGDAHAAQLEQRMAERLLEVEGLTCGYGEAVVLSERGLRARRRPLAGTARPQRHRQDDIDRHAGRRHAAPCRAHRARRARNPCAAVAPSAPAPASAGCRRSATSSSRSRSRRT